MATKKSSTHDGDSTDTLNYADLAPLGDARPELMVPRALDIATGNLAFYETEGKVRAGTILDNEGVNLIVHAIRQAANKVHRFVPLYRVKGKVEAKESGTEATMVTEHVNQSQILATTPVEKFLVPKAALSALRSRGVIMSPILIDDEHTVQRQGVDEHAPEDVHGSSPLQHTEPVEQKMAAAILTALDEITIEAHAGTPRHARCDDAQVFPITVINVLSVRDQIRYMRLLRGIERAMGVPPFGSVSVLLANVYTAAAALNIDMPQRFRGHGQHANAWLPDLSQLTDIAMHINMRNSGQHVSLRLSPIRSVTPQGRARGGRPQADIGQ